MPVRMIRRPPTRPSFVRWGAVTALAALTACSSPRLTEFPPSCARVAMLGDAAQLVRYRPGAPGEDLTDLMLEGRVAGFKGGCAREDKDTVRTVLTIELQLARGPALGGRDAAVPYFVAVRDGDRIRDKQVYNLRVRFPENQDQIHIVSDEITMLMPVNKEKSAASYDVLIGFQLTPEELEANRRRGPRPQ